MCYSFVYTNGVQDRSNQRKHGISFSAAARVFLDPLASSWLDSIVDDEERWHTVGLAGGVVLLLVVHTIREENGEEKIRIISARKANLSERAGYDAAD